MNVTLRVIAGPLEGREFDFDRHETLVVGRSSQAQISVRDDKMLSRNHFLIEFNPPACYLRDLNSTNGTIVNGLRVAEGVLLRDGDTIVAGASTFVVRVEETWHEIPKIACLGCGVASPGGRGVAARPGDESIAWLCDACAERRKQFPTPPEGYWIERYIGGGGMGEVYLARELATRQPVAIKMMMPTVPASDRARAYFRRELEVLRDLRHPYIVAFKGVVETEGQFQLIMEYVDGANARQWVESLPGPLPIATAARIGVQLLEALRHAHSKGYVHRDIKPSNILVTGHPRLPEVKLSDFGLAKSFRGDAGFAGLTHEGDVSGSIGFLSPDHIRDFRRVREPADIYGAGATLYYLLTGQYPFLDFDPARTDAYMKILEHPPVPLRVHRPDAPERLERILRKALDKQPDRRWTSAAAMAHALRPLAVEIP
jgi:serine/threonine-protein kinase